LLHRITLSNTHTHTHTHREDSSRRGIGLSQGPRLGNTQHPKETNIYAAGRIGTRNPSKLAAADPRIIKSDSYEYVSAGSGVQAV